MKQRFGGLLCLVLGAVLIGTGLNGMSSGAVGGIAPDCGTPIVGGGVIPCPTGTLSFTETTTGPSTPPANWTVHVTSTCLDPATGLAVDQHVVVPNGGTASSGDLNVFANPNHNTACSYTFVEESIPPNDTVTFDPASPQTIPFSGSASNSGLKVALTNAFAATTSSSSASTTPPPSSATSTTAPTTTSSATGPLSDTGPRESVRASLWIGIALCVLGLVLLFAGRRRRRPSHAA